MKAAGIPVSRLLAMAFGVLIVTIVVGGSLCIMSNFHDAAPKLVDIYATLNRKLYLSDEASLVSGAYDVTGGDSAKYC